MKENNTFNLVMRYTGLLLAVIILIAHIFVEPVDLLLLVIPAMMMGLDVKEIFRK